MSDGSVKPVSIDHKVRVPSTVYWFSDSRGEVIDQAVWDDASHEYIGGYSKKTAEALKDEYSDLVLCTSETAMRRLQYLVTDREPREITREDFDSALGALPPIRMRSSGETCSFFLGEAYAYGVHSAYVQMNGRYFTMKRPISESNDLLETMVREHLGLAAQAEPGTVEFSA